MKYSQNELSIPRKSKRFIFSPLTSSIPESISRIKASDFFFVFLTFGANYKTNLLF